MLLYIHTVLFHSSHLMSAFLLYEKTLIRCVILKYNVPIYFRIFVLYSTVLHKELILLFSIIRSDMRVNRFIGSLIRLLMTHLWISRIEGIPRETWSDWCHQSFSNAVTVRKSTFSSLLLSNKSFHYMKRRLFYIKY